jgi:hypothetical protein
MKRLTLLTIPAICLLSPMRLLAQSAVVDASAVDVVVDVLLLIAGLVCFSLCLKVFGLLRGGELSPGWQMLAVSFLIFSIGQGLGLLMELEFIAMPQNAISALNVVALFMIVFGVAKIKKSLT